MDRRTFLTLSALAATRSRLWLPVRRRSLGQLRFQLDDARRWALVWQSDTAVTIVDATELAVVLDGRAIPLGELTEVEVETRETPRGPATAVRGRGAGAVVDVEFAVSAPPAATGPRASITVTVSPEAARPMIGGVRFAGSAADGILPGAGALTIVANGYHSWSACAVRTVDPSPNAQEVIGHATGALTRAGRTLAFGFGADDAGDGVVRVAGGRVELQSNFQPPRPLALGADVVTLRLGFDPEVDAIEALRHLLAPPPSDTPSPLSTAAAPAGWCSWYEFYDKVTEADVLANLDFCATRLGPHAVRYIQLDDGYQKAAGDWDTNDKFPHGHRWLTDQIHSRGLLAGLWIAPFAVTDASGIPAAHPDWLIRKGDAPQVKGTNPGWGGNGTVYGLDPAHPEVQEWLTALARRVVSDWGYDYLKIDFLLYATDGDAHAGGITHAEAYRQGLSAIRRGIGDEVFLLGCGAPLQHAIGVVDGMRIGEDVAASWEGIQAPARAAALRGYFHRTAWFNDPDCLVVRAPLTDAEARVWASIVATSGGMTLLSDDLPKLPVERIPILQRALPAAAVTGRAIDAAVPETEIAPAFVAGETTVRFATWKFRTGDDPAYATREYDEDVWEAIPVPSTWEQAGHPGYDGIAWYRTRFTLPAVPAAAPPAAHLELGRLDDADETYLNGTLIGHTGAFPPTYQSAWQSFRRYAVPPAALNWGGENVLAIRVYDGGGPGGFWSVQRDRPPARWIVEGAPQWWTVTLVNWDDEARDLSTAPAALGIGGSRFTAYDVWADRPLADVTDSLVARLEPHESLTVALRPALTRPQVIGTTRHVVQGAVDLTDEKWSAETHTLAARSRNLDGRAYRVTIAVPKGWRAGTCKADPACTVRPVGGGTEHVVLEWAAGSGEAVTWSMTFRPAARTAKPPARRSGTSHR